VDPRVSRASEAHPAVLTLVASCAVLAAVITPAAIIVAWIVARQFSTNTLFIAAVSGGVCLFAAASALVTTFVANRIHAPVQGVLAALLFRMGVPLVAMVVLPNFGGPLAAPGMTSTILGVYLVALVVETLLSLRMVSPASSALRTA